MAVGYEMSLQDYLRVVLKRKWIILICTFAIFVTSIVYTSKLTPIYSTSGTVELQYQSTLASLMADALLYKGNELATAIQFATSMPVMKRAAIELGDVAEEAPETEKLIAASKIQGRVGASGDGRTNFISITFSDANPQYCARVVNAVMKAFAVAYEQRNTRDAQKIEDFLEEQMMRAEAELINAEKQIIIKETPAGSVSIGPGVRVGPEKKEELELELERVTASLAGIEQRLEELDKAAGTSEAPGDAEEFLSEQPKVVSLRAELIQAEMNLAMKLRDLTPRHPEVRAAQEVVRKLRSQIELAIGQSFADRRASLEANRETLKSRAAVLQSVIPQLAAMAQVPEEKVDLTRIQREIANQAKLFEFFRDKLEEKRYDRLVTPENSISIVEPAKVPSVPGYPNKTTNSLVGMAIGLMLGFALAFVVEAMDTSIGTIEDVERTTGLSVLGVIPSIAVEEEEAAAEKSIVTFDPDRVRTRDLKERLLELDNAVKRTSVPGSGIFKPQLITYYDPKSPISEAYRTLRTNVQFKGFLGNAKTLTITSSGPQEGKTTTLCNLAVTMAQSGQKVLAVGCNLRRPALHKLFGINKKPGVTDVLIGARDWRDVVQQTGIENLHAFCSGPIPPNPSELLGSPEMSELIRQVREAYDVVIFDCPPVLPVTDAAVLSSKIDCVLLVYYVNRAAREALLRAKQQLENVGAKILGVVLNHIPAEGRLGYSYYYYHYHYYGESSRDEAKNAIKKSKA